MDDLFESAYLGYIGEVDLGREMGLLDSVSAHKNFPKLNNRLQTVVIGRAELIKQLINRPA